jgi:hypothetical protein
VTEVQLAAAGMLGRGKSQKAVARFAGVTTRTIQNWIRDLPGFADEVERVRASSSKPEPRGVLLDALSARRDDGVDWNARVRAAERLLSIPDDEPESEPGRIIVYAPPAEVTMPEPGEYLLLLRSGDIQLASIPPPRGRETTTLFVLDERDEAVELLRELGADTSHLEAIPDAEFLTARERERTPGGLRFYTDRPC